MIAFWIALCAWANGLWVIGRRSEVAYIRFYPNVTVFTNETRGVYVGVGGDLAVRMAGGGNTVVFAGVLAGSLLPIVVDQILATGTTATNIVAVH